MTATAPAPIAEDTTEQFVRIPLSRMYPHPANRKHFNAASLKALAATLVKDGQLTPCLVRRSGDCVDVQILAGERRWKAAKLGLLPNLLCRVIECDDAQALTYLAIENKDREDVHPLDESALYAAMLAQPGHTVAMVGATVGKSETYVYARLQLAKLIEPAQKAAYATTDPLSLGHLLLLARLEPKHQALALKELPGSRWDGPMTVRDLQDWIRREIAGELGSAPFKLADATLVPKAGPCTTCPKRTSLTQELFADLEPAKKGNHDRCLDPECFGAKRAAHLVAITATVAAETGKPVVKISEGYRSQEKGVLTYGKYREVKKTDPKAQPAVVLDGVHEGHVKYIRTDAAPSTSNAQAAYDSTYAKQQRRAMEKAKIESARRKRILAAVRQELPTALLEDELKAVIEGFLVEMHHENLKAVAALLQVEPAKTTYGGREFLAPIVADIAKMARPELAKLLLTLPLLGDRQNNRRDPLLAAAKRYRVDVAAIDRAIAKEAGEKQKAKLAKKAKRPKQRAGDVRRAKKAGKK